MHFHSLLQKMSSEGSLDAKLSTKTSFLGLKLWVVICIFVFAFILLILSLLSIWVMARRKSRKTLEKFSFSQVPNVSKEIKVDRVGANFLRHNVDREVAPSVHNKSLEKGSEKMFMHLGMSKFSDADNISQCSSAHQHDRGYSSHSGEEGSSGTVTIHKHSSSYGHVSASPLVGLPEFSHLGWGHWFTLRDLEFATSHFSKDNVLGEGGYGIVYRGQLINGAEVAVKKLLNNLGQAEREFRVEVEAIGHVRHKNLVRLLGYCVEGIHRYVAPEYANTGLLNEKSDIYSFGVLMLEAVTGRDPVDYGRPANEVNLIEWLKMMVGNGRAEEVVDQNLEVKPPTRALKRALLIALRCVNPESDKRPKMSQVVQMLEADQFPLHEDRRRRSRTGSAEIESLGAGSMDMDIKVEKSVY